MRVILLIATLLLAACAQDQPIFDGIKDSAPPTVEPTQEMFGPIEATATLVVATSTPTSTQDGQGAVTATPVVEATGTPDPELGPIDPPTQPGSIHTHKAGDEVRHNLPSVGTYIIADIDGVGPWGARIRGQGGRLEAGDQLIWTVTGDELWFGTIIALRPSAREVDIYWLYSPVTVYESSQG